MKMITILRFDLLLTWYFMMISPIEKKFIFILTFASANPFLRPRDPSGGPDPQVGKPWDSVL